MARPLRIELSGGLYHVTSRGNRREAIYLEDSDRESWLALLGQVCERFNWRCHAYCQMTNHYHLVIETPDGNLAQGMRQLNGVFTQYVNRTHGRVGHVFQGRYKAILVDRDSYLLQLARYVVLNPLRAGMVEALEDWPWSSYRAMVGREFAPAWLQTDWLLGQFSSTRSRAQEQYRDFVLGGVGLAGVWDELRHQIFLGDDEFVSHMQDRIAPGQALNEVPRIQRRRPATPLETFRQAHEADPRLGMALAYLSGGHAMKDVAAEFRVHYTTVSRAVKAHLARTPSPEDGQG